MKKLHIMLVFYFVFSVFTDILAADLKGTMIHITDDGSEWPPYTYYKRIDSNPSKEIVGYSVDVIDKIFKKNGINYTIELLPWKRAQIEVKEGKKYKLILNASYSEERAANYNISLPYYTTNAYYFYSKTMFPNGLNIKSKADLKKFKVGGILGYNYSHYGLENNSIDTGAKDYTALIQKIKAKRVEMFLENLEILVGLSTISATNILEDKDLGYAPVPEMEPVKFYMLIPKNDEGAELKKIIDEGISSMEKSGELKKILKKYIP